MNEFDRIARYRPIAPPAFAYTNKETALRCRFVPCWVNSAGEPRALTSGGCHLRKSALAIIRKHMNAGGERSGVNHPSHYYTWDTSLPWNPELQANWTPTAQRPRDQWIPSYP